jgi:hypothetical protein
MKKNNAVIKYYFQNIVSSIIHVSNSGKQFLNSPYLQTFLDVCPTYCDA